MFFKLPNLHTLIKQKIPLLLRNLDLRTFGELRIVFSTKDNLLYLFYSIPWRCCLLHRINQNCFLFLYSSQEYPGICDIDIYADHTIILLSILSVVRYLICGNILTSELESDRWDAVDWVKKWLVDFNAGKTQLVLFDQSNNTGSIDVKMGGLFLKENRLLRCWVDLLF